MSFTIADCPKCEAIEVSIVTEVISTSLLAKEIAHFIKRGLRISVLSDEEMKAVPLGRFRKRCTCSSGVAR